MILYYKIKRPLLLSKSEPEARPVSRSPIWRHRSCMAHIFTTPIEFTIRPIQLRCRQIVNLLTGRASGPIYSTIRGVRFYCIESYTWVVKIVPPKSYIPRRVCDNRAGPAGTFSEGSEVMTLYIITLGKSLKESAAPRDFGHLDK